MEASFGKIQLPNFLLVDLFKDNLVLYDDLPPTSSIKQIKESSISAIESVEKLISTIDTSKKWYLGGNNKQITIIVKDNEAVFLRDEWLTFLTSILGACKLNIGDVAIVNYSNTPIVLPAINEQLKPLYFLLFDITAQDIQLPFTVPNYQLQKFGNATFLLAPSLAIMQGSTEAVKMEKSRLWLSLQNMFKI